jgi:3-hydroxybutyryl-CoA dehydrogenase
MAIRKVGVVGAGVMGRGVAQALAQTGHEVVLVDVAAGQLASAKTEIFNQLRMQRLLKTQPSAEPPQVVVDRIQCVSDLEAIGDAGYVIENITEIWTEKAALYPRLDAITGGSIIAANTSAIPITRLAALTSKADRVIGTHFMNPVPMKPTVEVIRGEQTSEATVQATLALLAAMGKDAIVVRDSPGFVSNRVLMLTVNEAIAVVHDQVAPAVDVDRVFTSCFGHAMGPLATADLIGLDCVLLSLEVLRDQFNDQKYQPHPLLRQMVDAGHHGRKSGRGFYDYSL